MPEKAVLHPTLVRAADENEYDVALSYADEDHVFVGRVRRLLACYGVRVYYDKDQKERDWGKDLQDLLVTVYRDKSNYCVIFVSRFYAKKRWTAYEHKQARERASKSLKEYILTYRLDDTEIEGLSSSEIYLNRASHNYRKLAAAIARKVGKPPPPLPLLFLCEALAATTRGIRMLLATLILSLTAVFLFPNRLLPVALVAKRLYEASREPYKGSVCWDGYPSPMQGSGACSGHGGIRYTVDSVRHTKEMKQCEAEAGELSVWPQ